MDLDKYIRREITGLGKYHAMWRGGGERVLDDRPLAAFSEQTPWGPLLGGCLDRSWCGRRSIEIPVRCGITLCTLLEK